MPTSIADGERRARLLFLRDLARIGVPREVRDNTDWSNRRAARYALQPYLPTDGDPLRDFQDLRYALTASGVRNTDVLTAAGGRRPWNIGDNALDVLLHGRKDPRAKRAKGGHLYGSGMPNKTQFPQSWTKAQAEEAYAATRLDPDWIQDLPSGDAFHVRDVDGVRVYVAFHPNEDGTERVIHGYPWSGEGVVETGDDGAIIGTRNVHDPIPEAYRWARGNRPEPPR